MGFEPTADDEPIWDHDEVWVWAADDSGDQPDGSEGTSAPDDADRFALVVPEAALTILHGKLALGAEPLPTTFAVELDDAEGSGRPTVWDNARVRTMIDEASVALSKALGESAGTLDSGRVEVIARDAQLLAALWGLHLADSSADDPSVKALDETWVDALAKLAADCSYMLYSRIRARRDGTFALRWRPVDRELVASAASELGNLILNEDSSVARLFPTAYQSDPERNAGWDALVRRELVEKRLAALETVAELLERRSCTADELGTLMRSVNDARLVLGTQLDVSEDGPGALTTEAQLHSYAIYEHLGFLLSQIIRAMRTTV